MTTKASMWWLLRSPHILHLWIWQASTDRPINCLLMLWLKDALFFLSVSGSHSSTVHQSQLSCVRLWLCLWRDAHSIRSFKLTDKTNWKHGSSSNTQIHDGIAICWACRLVMDSHRQNKLEGHEFFKPSDLWWDCNLLSTVVTLVLFGCHWGNKGIRNTDLVCLLQRQQRSVLGVLDSKFTPAGG